MSDVPPGQSVREIREAISPDPFGGPDWTREIGVERPDSRQLEMVRASAFGRARMLFTQAGATEDEAERKLAYDRFVLRCVDLMLSVCHDEQDVGHVLHGLL